jgi:16S rRNA (guanine966-N2)-methyltransferase
LLVIRIVSGTYRGRRIATPPGDTTRPATNAHRESVMNSLQMRLPEARVLDAFAGSGALGIEALSRGAEHVLFLERAARAQATVRKNLATLGVDPESYRLRGADTYAYEFGDACFDIAFVAPPYPHFREQPEAVPGLLAKLRLHIADDGVVVVQAEGRDFASEQPGWDVLREKTYGRTTFVFLEPEGT